LEEENMSTREYPLSGFSSINIRWALEMEIVRADTWSVVINGSDTQLKNLNVVVEGNSLNLSYDLNLVSFFAAPFSRVTARVTLPDLRELTISGASQVKVSGFKSPSDFGLNISGASKVNLFDMEAGNLKWDLSGASQVEGAVKTVGDFNLKVVGASKIKLDGSARNMVLDGSGASNLDLDKFGVQNANISLRGASKSSINVNGKMDVLLEGASSLNYKGQVIMGETRVVGASHLNRK
jgi:hypothetical protein